ncbi:MAG: ogr/Delta-like zinc finger family protein [Deltaproteobacteria bacterium]|nr:ogr/Delta-like zinc finger family protein [Deltaproteobacteria bacterium]
MTDSEEKTCPHCGQKLSKWSLPAESTWSDDYHYVCFNDECQYYVKGWKHMEETRGIKCSYRYMCGQHGQQTGPLSVPNSKMGRDMIIEDDEPE